MILKTSSVKSRQRLFKKRDLHIGLLLILLLLFLILTLLYQYKSTSKHNENIYSSSSFYVNPLTSLTQSPPHSLSSIPLPPLTNQVIEQNQFLKQINRYILSGDYMEALSLSISILKTAWMMDLNLTDTIYIGSQALAISRSLGDILAQKELCTTLGHLLFVKHRMSTIGSNVWNSMDCTNWNSVPSAWRVGFYLNGSASQNAIGPDCGSVHVIRSDGVCECAYGYYGPGCVHSFRIKFFDTERKTSAAEIDAHGVGSLIPFPSNLSFSSNANFPSRSLASLAELQNKKVLTNVRVCLVTLEFGLLSKGGIGTAFTQLANLLLSLGATVEVLYASDPRWSDVDFNEEAARWKQKGLTINHLLNMEARHVYNYSTEWLSDKALDWLLLRDGQYDIIHYHEWMGIGSQIARAKHQKIAFNKTTLIAQIHGSHRWASYNQKFGDSLLDISSISFERDSLQYADIVYSCSQYMLTWAKYHLAPKLNINKSIVMPNVYLEYLRKETSVDITKYHSISNFVFFGKTDFFKGIDTFCDAIDIVLSKLEKTPTGALVKPIKVSFLVRIKTLPSGENGDLYIERRMKKWREQYHIDAKMIVGLNSKECVEFLKSTEGAIAIMPSVEENSPFVVVESVSNEIPFLATNVGGTTELVHPEDRNYVLIERGSGELSANMLRVLREGQRLARLSFSFEKSHLAWTSIHMLNGRVMNSKSVELDSCIKLTGLRDRNDVFLRSMGVVMVRAGASMSVLTANVEAVHRSISYFQKEMAKEKEGKGLLKWSDNVDESNNNWNYRTHLLDIPVILVAPDSPDLFELNALFPSLRIITFQGDENDNIDRTIQRSFAINAFVSQPKGESYVDLGPSDVDAVSTVPKKTEEVEKVVLNNINEPAFLMFLDGDVKIYEQAIYSTLTTMCGSASPIDVLSLKIAAQDVTDSACNASPAQPFPSFSFDSTRRVNGDGSFVTPFHTAKMLFNRGEKSSIRPPTNHHQPAMSIHACRDADTMLKASMLNMHVDETVLSMADIPTKSNIWGSRNSNVSRMNSFMCAKSLSSVVRASLPAPLKQLGEVTIAHSSKLVNYPDICP